MLGKPPKHHP